MTRRWLAYLPLALAFAGAAVLPATASAAQRDDPPVAAACTQDTQEVTDLTIAVAGLGDALKATPPDPMKVSQATGTVFNAVTAAQQAGCLPALPTTPTTPAPPAAHPQAAANCAADTVKLLSASLDVIGAGMATTPDPTAVLTAASNLATAVTAINTDTCLPVTLPVPAVPAVTPPVS
jgi:hypothetical protein